jgi:hypothetical protein
LTSPPPAASQRCRSNPSGDSQTLLPVAQISSFSHRSASLGGYVSHKCPKTLALADVPNGDHTFKGKVFTRVLKCRLEQVNVWAADFPSDAERIGWSIGSTVLSKSFRFSVVSSLMISADLDTRSEPFVRKVQFEGLNCRKGSPTQPKTQTISW